MATGNVAAGWRRRQLATKMPTPRERRQTAEMQASDVYGMLDGDGSWSELHRRVIYTRARDREGRKPEPATHAWREPSEVRCMRACPRGDANGWRWLRRWHLSWGRPPCPRAGRPRRATDKERAAIIHPGAAADRTTTPPTRPYLGACTSARVARPFRHSVSASVLLLLLRVAWHPSRGLRTAFVV